jgi:hypothetical protein
MNPATRDCPVRHVLTAGLYIQGENGDPHLFQICTGGGGELMIKTCELTDKTGLKDEEE